MRGGAKVYIFVPWIQEGPRKGDLWFREASRVLSRIYLFGGEVDPKKNFGATQQREKYF